MLIYNWWAIKHIDFLHDIWMEQLYYLITYSNIMIIDVINNLALFICIIGFHGIIFWQSMIPHFTKITQLSLPSLNLNVIFCVVLKNQRDIQNDCCRCPFVHKDYVLITCIISQELVSSKKKLHYLDVWLLYKSFPYLQLCVIVHDLKLYPLKMWVFIPTV